MTVKEDFAFSLGRTGPGSVDLNGDGELSMEELDAKEKGLKVSRINPIHRFSFL